MFLVWILLFSSSFYLSASPSPWLILCRLLGHSPWSHSTELRPLEVSHSSSGARCSSETKRGQMSWSLALPEEKLKPWKPTCLSHMILSLCCYSGRLWNFGRGRVYIELVQKALVSFWEEQHVSVGSSTRTSMKCISQAAAQAVGDCWLWSVWILSRKVLCVASPWRDIGEKKASAWGRDTDHPGQLKTT